MQNEYSGMHLKFLKNSGSTNLWNPGTISCCGAESLRTITIHGVIEAQK
jgi:hypothetical protein